MTLHSGWTVVRFLAPANRAYHKHNDQSTWHMNDVASTSTSLEVSPIRHQRCNLSVKYRHVIIRLQQTNWRGELRTLSSAVFPSRALTNRSLAPELRIDSENKTTAAAKICMCRFVTSSCNPGRRSHGSCVQYYPHGSSSGGNLKFNWTPVAYGT